MLSIVVDKSKIKDDMILIDNVSDIKHIINVYRLNIDDNIRVVDGEYAYITRIVKVSKKDILVKIENKIDDKYSLNINIDIAIALIKNDKMNLLIQKLTEIGVNKIIPIKTERVVVKLDSKKDKWEDIVKESMKQCRAIVKTNIDDIRHLKLLEYNKYDKILFLYENSDLSLKINNIVNENDKNILCIIGPEGGFTTKEAEFLKTVGAFEISLGNRILRAETAAIMVASVLSHIYGY